MVVKIGLGYAYYKLRCRKCGRKILVEVSLTGTDHNADVMVNCAECLKEHGVDEKFKRKYPKIAEDIQSWIEG